jgi:uncharacterized protein involved in exopolysaccharide biosynthesis
MKTKEFKNPLEEGLPELSLRDLVSPLFRHKRLVIGVFVGVFLLSITVAWQWAAHYYVSSMQIVVEQERSDPTITAGQNAAVQNNKMVTTDQITSEVALLQGLDMMRSVASTCGLAEHKHWSMQDIFLPSDPARRQAALVDRAAAGLAKGIKVEAEKTSHVIDLKYGAVGAPETPACVLDNLSRLYVQKHLQLRRPVGSSEFFAEETDKYKAQLDGDESKLATFSRDEGVAAPDVLRTNMAQQVALSEAALNQAHQAVAADQQRIKDENAQMAKIPARSTTQQTTNASGGLLENLQASLLAAQVKRSQLLAKFEPTYPLVIEVNQEIAETQEAIKNAENLKYVNQTTDRDPTYEMLREDLAKTQADLASEQANAGALINSINNMKAQMVDLDSKSVMQEALLRNKNADEANYLLYLSKREQERSADALDLRRIADVEIAVPPVIPSLPAHNPLTVVLAGFLFALVMGCVAGAIAEFLDPSFRTPEEVAETLNIPVLASVPRQVA